jgi:hypothetical protein
VISRDGSVAVPFDVVSGVVPVSFNQYRHSIAEPDLIGVPGPWPLADH